MQRKSLERALTAKRESRRVEFLESFDPSSSGDWRELITHIAALANSGGGTILFGAGDGMDLAPVSALDPETILSHLRQFTDSDFAALEIMEATRESRPVVALFVGEAETPIVFSRSADVPADAPPLHEGTLYFRHGSKSEPATTSDLADFLERRMKALRKSWLSDIRRAVQMPGGSSSATLPPEIRDSDSPNATPIRIVQDARAPAYRLIDYDKTHPYRQKELLAAVRERLPGRPVNQFDLLTIRHMHGIDDKPEFSHKPLFGSRQYSERFLVWLVDQAGRDPLFFEKARRWYARSVMGRTDSQ